MKYKVTLKKRFQDMHFYFTDASEAISFAIKAFEHAVPNIEADVILEKDPIEMTEVIFPLVDLSGDEEV